MVKSATIIVGASPHPPRLGGWPIDTAYTSNIMKKTLMGVDEAVNTLILFGPTADLTVKLT